MLAGSAVAGSAGCNCADLAEPRGVLDIDDVLTYLDAFATGQPRADLAEPIGDFNIDDILTFLNWFADGELFQPNILWLSFEDTSYYTLPAYGQTAITTPDIDDRLFAKGLRFDRAWSTAPVCSPARSTIISGSYATTYGSDVHRQSINVPSDQYFFPRLLQSAGYYTTNNSKTDYNSRQSSQAWNRNGGSATWRAGERADRPFFAVFNSNNTHTSRVRSWHLEGRRDFAAMGITPTLPPHVPNVQETNSDYAFHLEGVMDINTWVGRHLDALESEGVADDTVVFFFSDHGGLLPRGKGYVFETGLRIPFGVRVPPRLRCLLPDGLLLPPGSGTDRLVGFVDFAATALSLAGLEAPDHMQGRAFLGNHAAEARDYQFGFVANREDHFAPDRAVTDGRYKYIRRFIPHRHHGLRNSYQWGMPAWIAWDAYVYEGSPVFQQERWLRPYVPGSTATKAELLFDTEADPFELNDLSEDPAHAARLLEFRGVLGQHMRETQDLGLFTMNRRDSYGGEPIHTWVRSTGYDVDGLITAAETASLATRDDIPALTGYLASEVEMLKFWGAIGFSTLAAAGEITAAELPEAFQPLFSSGNWAIAAAASEAYALAGHEDPRLDLQVTRVVNNGNKYAYSSLATLTRFDSVHDDLNAVVGPFESIAQNNFRARAVLINLNRWSAMNLFPGKYNAGVNVNTNTRGIGPLP